ncbi:MAG: FixH family protein [Arenimonas sp.]|nr:FixH family protein [Arenimonas sp.]
MTEARKAWQEPMVWLMAGIPVLTVFAGIATLVIALQSGPMDLVPASVQRISQAQTLNGAEDRTAAEGNYRAFLIIDQHSQPWTIRVKTVPMSLAAKDLHLLFVHPNRAERDIDVLLPANAASTALPKLLDFKEQQVMLRDAGNSWRLVGVYDGQSNITLTPALLAQ